MSTPQGNDACRITVDPSTADLLRIEAKKVLMFNHEPFDLLTDIGADRHINAIIMSEIHANRHSVEALNKVLNAYSDTITT